tara:strand:- start:787 stop:993 length:207 start_codon:yes stop_codon:yes gene_type:complete
MKFTDRQKHFIHEAIHSKLIKAESMCRYLEREMNKENSIEIKNSYKSCLKYNEREIEELEELRSMLND